MNAIEKLEAIGYIFSLSESGIKNFAEVLANDAGDALMQWMIDGAVRFHKSQHKLSIPDFVTEAIDKYRSENDWMQAFLDECCDVEKGKVVASGKLYEEYRYWADKTGEYKRNSKDFKAELDKRGFEFRKTNKRNAWYGIAIKQSDFIAN